ncbi:MAG: zinc-dependent alcohol dehydrogenase family protein [Gammaproteobacteria bacterium]
MKAVMMTKAGGVEVLQLQEIAEPQLLAPDQLKVNLHAAGINPIDTKIRSRGVFFENGLPAVLGCDGAGVVTETGEEVSQFKVGDKVWFCDGGLGREQGNYAQSRVIEADKVCAMPRNLDFVHAAAGPLVLITAWEAMFDRALLTAGQSVLIHAGAGGVGHVAIQLAKQRGARVATTVSSPEKADYVRELGADLVINYREQDFVAEINHWTDGQGVDVVFDTVGPAVCKASIPAVAHYGTLVTLIDPGTDVDWKEARIRNIRFVFELMLTPMLRDLPKARAHQVDILNSCRRMIENEQLSLHVAHVLPLEQAPQAHSLIEQGSTQGKIVLQIS